MTQYVPAIEACKLWISQSLHTYTFSWIAGLEDKSFYKHIQSDFVQYARQIEGRQIYSEQAFEMNFTYEINLRTEKKKSIGDSSEYQNIKN